MGRNFKSKYYLTSKCDENEEYVSRKNKYNYISLCIKRPIIFSSENYFKV